MEIFSLGGRKKGEGPTGKSKSIGNIYCGNVSNVGQNRLLVIAPASNHRIKLMIEKSQKILVKCTSNCISPIEFF